jgi:prepilin-type N-terminal cleavage/methylation domain-containing protein/prepilin-type processing-associated H-X9-DG protein
MHRPRNGRRSGFTLIELLVVMGIIALLLAILLPALNRARATTKRVKDATQIQQVHKGFLTLAREFNGVFPTPGLIDRLPVNGQNRPGAGNEDVSQNDHAKLYAACIAQNAFSTDVLVTPAEVSTNVLVMANYNHDAYQPITTDQYWDPLFQADLRPGQIAHVSYGTLELNGQRKSKQWRDTLDSKFVVLANRGVQNGDYTANVYNASKTLQIHGGAKEWDGNICFNDGHVIYDKKFQPDGIVQFTSNNTTIDDNIFKDDAEALTGDAFLTMVYQMSSSGAPSRAWD